MRTAFFLLAVLIVASPAFAWHTNTHLQMTKDAIALMPQDFQKLFTEHQRFVESGIKDPDYLIRDWENHYYIPATMRGGALQRIDKLVEISSAKLKSTNSLDAAKQLCYLAHYIADLWSPESILSSNNPASNQSFVLNNSILVLYTGYQLPLVSIHDYLQKRSEWRWRLESSDAINGLLYSEAVNDIAVVWLTLWQNSGRTVAAQPYQVLEHRKGAIHVNFEQLMMEEALKTDEARARFRYANSPEDQLNYLSNLAASSEEMARIKENVIPSDAKLEAASELRNQEALSSLFGVVRPEFTLIDSSLKNLGSNSFFVARIRNLSGQEVPAITMMYPGVKGPFAKILNLKPGEIIKVEAVLPADATKDKIQLIFATPNAQ